jgi:predicted dienelactone hydrolase
MLFVGFGLETQATTPQIIDVWGLKVSAWIPKEPKGKPVVLFSHGYEGCAKQQAYLQAALADAGYAVFAPDHKDAACNGKSFFARFMHPPFSFEKPETWNATAYADHREDMEKLLAALPTDPRYNMLDWRRVGMAGHSLGAYAGLGMAGALPGWKDPHIRAVLALSPSITPLLAQHGLGKVTVPVMYQGGTSDPAVTPYVSAKGGAYDQTLAPKYFVEFTGAEHLSFTDKRGDAYYEDINRYAVAFFDTYLKDKPFPKELMHKKGKVEEVRIEK